MWECDNSEAWVSPCPRYTECSYVRSDNVVVPQVGWNGMHDSTTRRWTQWRGLPGRARGDCRQVNKTRQCSARRLHANHTADVERYVRKKKWPPVMNSVVSKRWLMSRDKSPISVNYMCQIIDNKSQQFIFHNVILLPTPRYLLLPRGTILAHFVSLYSKGSGIYESLQTHTYTLKLNSEL
jgi:hypothetical protein